MGQNLIEKIAQRYAVDLPPGHTVRAGDFLYIRPAHVMTHDNTGAVMAKYGGCHAERATASASSLWSNRPRHRTGGARFKGIGAKRIALPRQTVFTLDHDVQNTTEKVHCK